MSRGDSSGKVSLSRTETSSPHIIASQKGATQPRIAFRSIAKLHPEKETPKPMHLLIEQVDLGINTCSFGEPLRKHKRGGVTTRVEDSCL